jgi:tetratricopeptide (TPR) repeat protein
MLRLRMWTAFFLAVATVSTVHAQEVLEANVQESSPESETYDDATARTHFEAGQNHYEEGRYDQAITEFEAALGASPRADLLYNLYLACERAGRLDEAVGYLERYVAEGNLEPSDRDMLNARLENLRRRADSERDRDAVTPMTRADGGLSGAALGMITSFAVAGAGAVLFGTFAALSEAEDQSLAGECAPRCTEDQVADLGTFNLLADIGIGVASAGVVAGLVFLIVELASGDSSAESPVALRPYGAEVSF